MHSLVVLKARLIKNLKRSRVDIKYIKNMKNTSRSQVHMKLTLEDDKYINTIYLKRVILDKVTWAESRLSPLFEEEMPPPPPHW